MPLYRYRAVNPSGEVAVGELDAANEARDRRSPARPGPDADADRARDGRGRTARGRRGARRPRQRLFEPKTRHARPAPRDDARARDAVARRPAARPRARDPDQPRAHAAGRRRCCRACATTCAAARRCRRRSTRGAKCSRASTSTSCAPAKRAARSARCCSAWPTRWSATRSCARSVQLRAHLSVAPRARRRGVGRDPARVRRAAVRVDVRAGGQGAADPDARRGDLLGKFMRGYWWARARRRVPVRHVVSPPRPQPARAAQPRRAAAAHAAARRPRRQGRDRALRAHARHAARQRRDAAVGRWHRARRR